MIGLCDKEKVEVYDITDISQTSNPNKISREYSFVLFYRAEKNVNYIHLFIFSILL